ncbi:uncharacterized protein LOC127286685 [Leptopilina boulardi]|uniref:uncharacterized protein LOC127286685 n=1 Tax=Leptopilina boulardi TaxID=63433 RepID=UPI0021F54A4D|nr:uncharacterized protein LOC127286685 [Leptopilina boulardi]
MEYSKEGRFFPNECYVCKSTKNLIRCKCNMISYCGENHRMQHYSIHENICNAVMELLNEKNVFHIFEELYSLFGKDWTDKRQQIYKNLELKLKRTLSPLEEAMFNRPRVCYRCRQANQEKLKNCLECPIASFCTDCLYNEEHDKNCKLMRTYLNMLQTADVLNIDLQFLPSCFPFIKKKFTYKIDRLTYTMLLPFNDSEASALKLIASKINLIQFIDAASIFHTALQKIENINPLEIIIHIDALGYQHVIIKENFWEFLLHLNSDIKILKIVITGSEDQNNLKTSLCRKCRSMKKNLSIEIHSMPYEEYMLQKNYQKPTALFYCKFENDENFCKTKKWIKIATPIILYLSKENFDKLKCILEFSFAKFEIIYGGEINTPFSDKSTHENDDYILIFKSKGTKDFLKSQVDYSNTSGNNEITISANPEVKSLSSIHLDCEDVFSNAKKDLNKNLESKLNNSFIKSQADSNAKIVGNKLLQKNETQDNCKTKEIEDKYLAREENRMSDDKNKISDEQNIVDDNQKSNKEIQVMQVNFMGKHISFLQNENHKLRDENIRVREHLNLSIKRTLELQEICSKLVKKVKLIKENINIDDLEKKIV